MRIRLARSADAEAIRRIYNLEVVSSQTSTFDLVPRTPEEQRAWMERHEGAHPVIVAVAPDGNVATKSPSFTHEGPSRGDPSEGDPSVGHPGEVVLGFGALSTYRSRPAYATTVENSVYVDRDHRGEGIGRAVLEELVRLAGGHGFHSVVARVVRENEASIELHRACGFGVVGIEREIGRKHGRWLDVVELQRML